MQIALGRRGDYAVRAVLALARSYGQGRRKAREIAQAMDIPERYLPQILAPFVREGTLTAVAGPDGGYELARAPSAISLLEVVETAEGRVASNQCVLRGGPCDWEHACPMHAPWSRAQTALAQELARTTFEELARSDEAIEVVGEELPVAAPPETAPRHGARRGRRGTPTGS